MPIGDILAGLLFGGIMLAFVLVGFFSLAMFAATLLCTLPVIPRSVRRITGWQEYKPPTSQRVRQRIIVNARPSAVQILDDATETANAHLVQLEHRLAEHKRKRYDRGYDQQHRPDIQTGGLR